MFGWLKKFGKKANDTLDQTKQDLNETAGKIQEVLDESNDSVKVIAKVVVVALTVSILTNCVTMFVTLSKHKYRKIPTITIQNLYLGGQK